MQLTALWLVLLLTSAGLAAILVGLYRRSAEAQLSKVEARAAAATVEIQERLAAFSRTYDTAPSLSAAEHGSSLVGILDTVLQNYEGFEGGVWSHSNGFIAYAFPTYPGTGTKTDLPAAEAPKITELCERVQKTGRPLSVRFDAAQRALILHARPTSFEMSAGAIWAMNWVPVGDGEDYAALKWGFTAVSGGALLFGAWLLFVLGGWYRRLSRIEWSLSQKEPDSNLALVGDKDLDRLITALNSSRERLRFAQAKSEDLSSQLARAARAATLSEVASGLAHELRNPLGAMRLKAENALAAVPPPPSGPASALSAILVQVARLESILQHLLTITRQTKPAREQIEVGRWLREILGKFADPAEVAQVRLSWHCADDAKAFIDPAATERALGNLLHNAIAYTPPQGTIEVRAESDAQARLLRLTVSDTGPGVPPADHVRIFEPFFTRRPGGHGLGLAIAREVAEAHGGHLILLARTPGAHFELTLTWPAS